MSIRLAGASVMRALVMLKVLGGKSFIFIFMFNHTRIQPFLTMAAYILSIRGESVETGTLVNAEGIWGRRFFLFIYYLHET